MSASKFLFKSLLKQPRRAKGTEGFTLIELLVAMILAVLVITPLLTLVLNLLDTDRQEQVKNSSQQEIQAALDYITQDMKQAVYVYDAVGLGNTGIQSQIPPGSGAVPGCSPGTCVPVLAFWKRKYLDRNDLQDPTSPTKGTISTLDDSNKGSDRFVYSLVVYYTIQDKDQKWSQAARIGRFEIRDGIPDPNNINNYILKPDTGFANFKTSSASGSLKLSMNSWKNSGTPTNAVETLIDFIDDTPSTNQAVATDFQVPDDNACSGPANNTTGVAGITGTGSSRVPSDAANNLKLTSFYACVNPVNTLGQSVAQIYIRGNALARLGNDPNKWVINSSNKDNQLAYRPNATIKVLVRSLISN